MNKPADPPTEAGYTEKLIAALRAEVVDPSEHNNLSPVLKEGFRVLNAKFAAAADELERLHRQSGEPRAKPCQHERCVMWCPDCGIPPPISEQHEVLIERLRASAAAYPEDMFPPVEPHERIWLHQTRPGLMDRIAGAMGRHMSKQLLEAAAALECPTLTKPEKDGGL